VGLSRSVARSIGRSVGEAESRERGERSCDAEPQQDPESCACIEILTQSADFSADQTEIQCQFRSASSMQPAGGLPVSG
jgi:hypothetical protein